MAVLAFFYNKICTRELKYFYVWAQVLAFIFVCSLALSLFPASAFAYFNRGSVSISLGTSALEMQAGSLTNVSVTITPASDQQTEGCGMPKCPQGCAASCVDENGQCLCAGSEYKTYYSSVVVLSSDSSIVQAKYNEGTLSIYARSAGEATLTITASLRQHTDSQATIQVKVTGQADEMQAGSNEFTQIPQAASAQQEDKASVVEKISMGRTIRYVCIDDTCTQSVAALALSNIVGVDGDLTFWQGDTYYHPNYSLTFTGTAFDTAQTLPTAFDPSAEILFEPTEVLTQPLNGVTNFIAVDMAQKTTFAAQGTIYVYANGLFSDGTALTLFSYSSSDKKIMREDAAVEVVGGYVRFTVSEGKTYIVSTENLAVEAGSIVNGTSSAQLGNSGQNNSATQTASTLPTAAIAVGILALAVAVVVVVAKKKGSKQ